jgi:Tfp pilus assembly protein PilF
MTKNKNTDGVQDNGSTGEDAETAGPGTHAFDAGQAHQLAGNLEEAEREYRAAIDIQDEFFEAHVNLGVVLQGRGNASDAATAFLRAIDLNPEMPEIHYALGTVYQDLDRTGEAQACFQCALDMDSGSVEALNGLAICRQTLGDVDGAMEAFESAIGLNPDFAEAHNNLGTLYSKLGRMDDALACFQRAIDINPVYAEAHRNYSHVLLLQGRFAEGWPEFRWRWHCRDFTSEKRIFPQAPWAGQPLKGKTILVWGEQGVGDEIHFAEMVPDLFKAGARVILECEPRLMPLFRRSFPAVSCISRQTPPAAEALATGIDFQCPSGDLAGWLRTERGDFPGSPSYLSANHGRVDALKEAYQAGGRDLLAGIAWVSKNPEAGKIKSLDLADWRGMADIPGVRFIDLQYGDTIEERARFEADTGAAILHDDSIDQMADLDAFSAQVAAMDLVISASNTTVHMAGALGVSTWVMLNTVPLCVWMLEGDTSPWYPSLRLFRQSQAGVWDDVVGKVAAALKDLVAARG